MRVITAVLTSFAVIFLPLAALGNDYSIAREFSADYGSYTVRADQAVTCVGSGSGFVFNDLWQGTENDAGWVEVGTSYCDAADARPKFVWAYRRSNGYYYEQVAQYNVGNGTRSFLIQSPNADGTWKIYIGGTFIAQVTGMNGYQNSADVGLEVTASRMSSTVPATYSDYLRAYTTRSNYSLWSGMDACSRTSAAMSGRWISSSNWRHSLNVSGLSNSSCP